MLLLRDVSGEVIAAGEEGVGAELEGESRGGGFEEEESTLEVGFGMIEIVGVGEQQGSDPEAGADLDHGEEGDAALAEGFETLHCSAEVAVTLGVVGESPETLRHHLHRQNWGRRRRWLPVGFIAGFR